MVKRGMRHLKAVCSACRGSGWLCEAHPAQPWDHDQCDGVGIACRCNGSAALPHTDVFVDFDAAHDTRH